MSTNIYTREECKKLIDQLKVVNYNLKQIGITKKNITPQLMESILFHTKKCRDNISERIYWILNNIEDNPICKECRKQFTHKKFYGIKNGYYGKTFCSNKCGMLNQITQQKSKETNQQNLGVDYPSQSSIVKEKSKETSQKNWGYSYPSQSPIIKQKIQQTCLVNFNVKNPFSSPIIKEKIKYTHFENLQYENPAQSPIIKQKIRTTCQKKYNVDCPFQSENVKQKSKETNQQNLGVDYPSQSSIVKEKSKETNQQNLGVDYPSQSPIIKERIIQTYLKNWNAEHPMQNKEFFIKNKKTAYKQKILVLPSGKQIIYQGYENIAILELLEDGYLEEQIITDTILIPKIDYFFNQKNKSYYPDIYILHENKIIEVKSEYTYSQGLEQNFAKRQACLDQGYQFEFWICSDKKVLEIK